MNNKNYTPQKGYIYILFAGFICFALIALFLGIYLMMNNHLKAMDLTVLRRLLSLDNSVSDNDVISQTKHHLVIVIATFSILIGLRVVLLSFQLYGLFTNKFRPADWFLMFNYFVIILIITLISASIILFGAIDNLASLSEDTFTGFLLQGIALSAVISVILIIHGLYKKLTLADIIYTTFIYSFLVLFLFILTARDINPYVIVGGYIVYLFMACWFYYYFNYLRKNKKMASEINLALDLNFLMLFYPQGNHWNENGVYIGKTDEFGNCKNEFGKYLGKTEMNKHYNKSGVCVGRTDDKLHHYDLEGNLLFKTDKYKSHWDKDGKYLGKTD